MIKSNLNKKINLFMLWKIIWLSYYINELKWNHNEKLYIHNLKNKIVRV